MFRDVDEDEEETDEKATGEIDVEALYGLLA